nr:hypothetical protein [Kordiimonas marina]
MIELLKQVEHNVQKRLYHKARPDLIKIFDGIESGKINFGGKANLSPLAEAEATRVAMAITQILTDPEYHIDSPMFLEFNRFKRAISQIFEISGFHGTTHLTVMMGDTNEKGQRTFRRSELLKLFTGLSLNAMNDMFYDLLLQLEPKQVLPIVIGMLSEQLIYTNAAEEIRSRILADGERWEDVDLHLFSLVSIGPAYMGCSYAVAPHKHLIKKCFNKVVKRWLVTKGIKDTKLPKKRALKKRPKAVIFAEFYNSNHAMHRCYGPSIRAMMEHFDTTLLVGDTKIDDELKSLAHHVEEVKFQHGKPEDLIKKLQSYNPDVLYYPSVGMRFSSIVASSVRIAPIQVMTFGHPATTYSDVMDYVILPDKLAVNVDTMSEKVMMRPTIPFFTHRGDAEDIPADIRLDPETVRIAVPAWSRKITPEFLNTCRMIRERAHKPVEFWFFPNAVGPLHQAITRRYAITMPGDKVLPRKNYNDYIRDLNQCDIFLSSFPFGATNGIVDAARQGLPIINITGDEAHTVNDSSLVADLDQPDWLTTHSVEDYIDAAVRLVDDPGLRVQISRNILDGDPDKAFFVDNGETSAEFSLIMNYIYHHHDEIQASDKRAWTYEEMVAAKD